VLKTCSHQEDSFSLQPKAMEWVVRNAILAERGITSGKVGEAPRARLESGTPSMQLPVTARVVLLCNRAQLRRGSGGIADFINVLKVFQVVVPTELEN